MKIALSFGKLDILHALIIDSKARSVPETRILRASADQFADIRAIVNEYNNAIGVVLRDSEDQLRAYLAPDAGVWLAFSGDVLAGCIALKPLAHLPDACEVKRLYVRPAFRRLGIADALLDALETDAVQQHYRYAYLDTKDDLTAAIRFYQRRGYRDCDRYNDNPQATIFMRRQLIA